MRLVEVVGSEADEARISHFYKWERFNKIDRPCITGAVKSKSWRKVLESIINMARNIGAKTIGEGIETEKEKELVTEYGVDFAQGYYFGIPSLRLLSRQELNSRNVL